MAHTSEHDPGLLCQEYEKDKLSVEAASTEVEDSAQIHGNCGEQLDQNWPADDCPECERRESEEVAEKIPFASGVLLAILLLCVCAFGQTAYSGKDVSSGYAISGYVSGGGVALGENVYCPAGTGPNGSNELTEGAPTWGAGDGQLPVPLPTACMNTAMSSTPSNGSVITVSSGVASDLQNALNNAVCGDVIQITAGTSYTGSFTVPAHGCNGAHWITIESSGISNANFPAEHVQATPCLLGIENDSTSQDTRVAGYPTYSCNNVGTNLAATIIGNSGGQSTFQFASGADHYRFIGLEITKTPNLQFTQIVSLDPSIPGNQQLGANHIIFDRCIIHGQPWTMSALGGTETQGGVDVNNSTWVGVINSWDYDTYCDSSCTDSQAFAGGTGAYASGNFKIYNSLLASAGETLLFGGGGQGPGTPTPDGFEFRANHSFKPLVWMIPISTNPVLFNVDVKNLMEYKNINHAFVEGNKFENEWHGQSDQFGVAVIFDPRNQNHHSSVEAVFNGTQLVTLSSGSFTTSCAGRNCTSGDSACAPGGCIFQITDPSRQGVDDGADYRVCQNNGSNGCYNTSTCSAGGTPLNMTTQACFTTAPPTSNGGSISASDCYPGDCPSCKATNLVFRFNEIYNSTNGGESSTAQSALCLDETQGASDAVFHDDLWHGIEMDMSNGPGGLNYSEVMDIESGQITNVIANVEVSHETAIVTLNSPTTIGALGNQVDHTDLQWLTGINVHDTVSVAAWHTSHTKGSIVMNGVGGNGGLANTWQTDACQPYYPNDANNDVSNGTVTNPNGIPADTAFTFSPAISNTNYFVTVNGSYSAITSPISAGFTLTASLSQGDAITVRNLNSCSWTFHGNLLGEGMPGSGKPEDPYPASNSTNCGVGQAYACILNVSGFEGLFQSWDPRNGNYTIANSNYIGSATDAASRSATGKNPGADLTTLNSLLNGVGGSPHLTGLSVNTSSLPTSGVTCAAGRPYADAFSSSAGASPYKQWYLVSGSLPTGIMFARNGTINGPFIVNTVSSSSGVADVRLQGAIVSGTPVVGQTVLLSNFENGTGAQQYDGEFNGTCTISTVVSNQEFQCSISGLTANTSSHSPNSLWQGPWKHGTTYNLNEEVIYNLVAYYSLIANNQGNEPDKTVGTDWALYTLPVNLETGALATFAPTTSGSYSFTVGAADGAFQTGSASVTMTVSP